jgi:hypothetical protein
MPGWFWCDSYFRGKAVSIAADRYTIVSPAIFQVEVDGMSLLNTTAQELDLSVSATWDTISPTNYTTAANRIGLNFYIYACQPVTGRTPVLLVSHDSNYPSGYTTSNSRKVAGFHCFCASMSVPVAWVANTAYSLGQTIIPTAAAIVATPALANYWYRCITAGTSHTTTEPTWNQVVDASPAADGTVTWICENKHSLANYVAGDVLPNSVWDLRYRAITDTNDGLVYHSGIKKWVAIYQVSGTVLAPTILHGGTHLKLVTWYNAVDIGASLKMHLPRDYEFQIFSEGSNQLSQIGSDPTTTVGSTTTAGRRMVSHIGVEGCSGYNWQWLDEQSYRYDAPPDHYHKISTISGGVESKTSGNAVLIDGTTAVDLAPAWSWTTETTTIGYRGQVYKQGTYGTAKLIAGGTYNSGYGSRGRIIYYAPWTSEAAVRLVAKHVEKEYV